MPTERAERYLVIAPLAREHPAQRQLLIIQRRIAVRRYKIRGVDCPTEKAEKKIERAMDADSAAVLAKRNASTLFNS